MVTNRTRRRMATLVHRWETGGEPRRAFAQRHGLTVSQFDYWKRQVRREGVAEAAIDFAPVHVVDSAAGRAGAGLEVVLSTGERLTIHEGTSLDLVRAVVSMLRPSC